MQTSSQLAENDITMTLAPEFVEPVKKIDVRRRRWLNIVRIVVTIALLGYVVRSVDFSVALTTMLNANVPLICAMIGILTIDRMIATFRWYILLIPAEKISYWRVLRLILVSNFAGYAIPGTVGVELVRIYSVARGLKNTGIAVSSVLVERLFAVFTLAVLVLLGLALKPSTIQLPAAIGHAAIGGLVVLLSGGFMIMFRPFRNLTLLLLSGKMLSKLREKLAETYQVLDMYRGKILLMLVSLITAFVFQLGRILTAVVGAFALGADIDPMYFLIFMPIIMFALIMPISVGGFGVQEVGFVYLFGMAGMTPETALMLSMLLRLTTFLLMAPGAWLYWRNGIHW